jgi:hypothetical protein
MKAIAITIYLTSIIGFAQVINIKSVEKTDHPYALKFLVEENYHQVIVDCDSFLHGVFLFYNEKQYDWHEIDEDSCFDMVGEVRNNLGNKDRVKLRLMNFHPFYQIQPDQLR